MVNNMTHLSRGKTPPQENAARGRPRSIPPRLFVRVLRLKLRGLGYQTIATELSSLGVSTSRGSVERLVKGKPPYEDE
jgi:hypothetical protein